MRRITSTKRRMQRIFRRNGRSLIVAMDHGAYMRVLPQLADTGRVLDEIREAGGDAVLTTLGIATTYAANIGEMGLVLRLDGSGSILDESHRFTLRHTVEDALRIGADGVACMGMPGAEGPQTFDNLGLVAGACLEWQMPLMAEMLPGAWDERQHTVENVALAARIGVELGADIIKTTYAGDGGDFSLVSEGVFAPVVVLGGTKKETDRELLAMVRAAVVAGASGVAVGRNVWQHADVGGITRALVRIIHEDAGIDEALAEIAAAA